MQVLALNLCQSPPLTSRTLLGSLKQNDDNENNVATVVRPPPAGELSCNRRFHV